MNANEHTRFHVFSTSRQILLLLNDEFINSRRLLLIKKKEKIYWNDDGTDPFIKHDILF